MGKIRYNRTGRTLVCGLPIWARMPIFRPKEQSLGFHAAAASRNCGRYNTQNAAGFAADAPELDRIPV